MFDKFPRQDLPFPIRRRELLPALVRELVVFSQATQGRLAYRLSELGSLPDEQLAVIVPVLNAGFEIYVEQDHLWARDDHAGSCFEEFPLVKENTLTFNMFDGTRNLGEIGKRLALEMGWEEARGFAHARGLFLSLASHLVCVPRNPLE